MFSYLGNFLLLRSGNDSNNKEEEEEEDKIMIIDYEYANYNPRAFDLANHFCEYCGFDSNYEFFLFYLFLLK